MYKKMHGTVENAAEESKKQQDDIKTFDQTYDYEAFMAEYKLEPEKSGWVKKLDKGFKKD